MKKEIRIFFGKLSGFISTGLLFIFTAFHAVFFVRAIYFYSIKINTEGRITEFDIQSVLLSIVKGFPVTAFMLLFVITSLVFCVYFTVKLIKVSQISFKSIMIILPLFLFTTLLFRMIPLQSYVVAMYSMVRFSVFYKLGFTSSVLYFLLKMCLPISIVFATLSLMLLFHKSEAGKESAIENMLLKHVSQKKQILFLIIIPFVFLLLLGVAVFLIPIMPNFYVLDSLRFIGNSNYVRLFSEDKMFEAALINTFMFPIISIIVTGLFLIAGKTIKMKNTFSINGMLYYPLCYLLLNIVFKNTIDAGTVVTQIFGYPIEGYSANAIKSHILDYSDTLIMGNSLILLWIQLFATFIIFVIIWNVDACISYIRSKHGVQAVKFPIAQRINSGATFTDWS